MISVKLRPPGFRVPGPRPAQTQGLGIANQPQAPCGTVACGASTLQRLAFASVFLFVLAIPLDVWPIPGVGSVAAGAGGLLLATGLWAVFSRGAVRNLRSAHVVLACFVLWCGLSSAWSVDPEASLQRALTYLQLWLFLALFWQFVRTRDDRLWMMFAFVLGAELVAAGTIASYWRGEMFRDAGRYAIEGYDPNDLGVTLALAIPMAWALIVEAKGWPRRIALFYVPVALAATGLTASRGGMLAILTATSVIPLSWGRLRTKGRLAVLALGAAVVCGVVYFVPTEAWARILSAPEAISHGTMTHRGEIWAAGWSLVLKSPLVGVGAGAFASAVQPLLNWHIAAHNTPLSLAAEVGTIGLVLFFLPIGNCLASTSSLPRVWRTVTRVLFATWFVGVSSLTWEYRKATWLIIAFLIQASADALAERRSRPRAMSAPPAWLAPRSRGRECA